MTDMANSPPFSPTKVALKTGCAWLVSACLASAFAQTVAQEVSPLMQTNASAQKVPTPPASTAWQQLNPQQKQALAPLGAQWGALTGQQQNKWLAISQNFAQLSVPEQITMHARMADWVALSPQQRNLARLNFNTIQKLPKEDKKAQWEAYQALSAEERRLLSGGSAAPTKSAAPTAKPLEAHRVVKTTVRPTSKDQAQPTAIDPKTLLPPTPSLTAPAPTAPKQPGTTDTVQQATGSAPS
jgi:hypothetical protein